MQSNDKNKNIVVAGLWKTRNGHYNSLPVDEKSFDTLKGVFSKGGKFLVRNRTAEAIANSRNPETAPVAYLEFVPKEAVEEFKAKQREVLRSGI